MKVIERMDLTLAINKILEGRAVLFAGAGFSYGAKNCEGKVPSATGLKEQLLHDLAMPSDSGYALEILAEYYKKEKSPTDLVALLRKNFVVLQTKGYHTYLTSLPWKRIYTTNYDQTIEIASKENAEATWKTTVVLSDPFDITEKRNACIHLNGCIERLNEDKLDNEFKLSDTSYVDKTFTSNPWFEFMANDFESASAIVVIGYSMQYDLDIKRLFSTPNISKKVVFINSTKDDKIARKLLENYGTCYPIGIEAFGKQVKDVQKDFVPALETEYKSFRYMYHETLTALAPSFEEIVRFYTEGIACDKLFAKDATGMYTYILQRRAMDIFLRSFRSKKVFIATSNLGNGKSVFLDMIEKELQKDDVKVFSYVHRFNTLDEEIEAICNETKKCVIIIDNYQGHLDILQKFAYYVQNNNRITFLLSARTSINQMFYKRLERVLYIQPEDVRILNLNLIYPGIETNTLAHILEDNALLTEKSFNEVEHYDLPGFINNECRGCFSDLLLKLFESSNIKNKLAELYSALENEQNLSMKRIAIFMLLKNISNYDLTISEILDLFEADYIQLTAKNNEFMQEIFTTYDETDIKIRSSIVSKYLLENVIKLKDIIDAMKTAFLAADNKAGRTYQEFLKGMVSHSQFMFFTNAADGREKLILIENFYNDIRNTKFAKHNPFFWEQFASAYIDMKKYDMVKKCIDNALIAAKQRGTGFVPFQVMTVQGRYFVEKCYDELVKGACSASDAVDAVKLSSEAVLKHYTHPENNHYYVFKVARRFADIYMLIEDSIDKRESSILIEKMTVMKKHMEVFLRTPEGAQYSKPLSEWIESLKEALERAKIKANSA